jgi:hypothetical protein
MHMSDFDEKIPINPLTPVIPSRRPARRKQSGQQQPRRKNQPMPNEAEDDPHVDEYA